MLACAFLADARNYVKFIQTVSTKAIPAVSELAAVLKRTQPFTNDSFQHDVIERLLESALSLHSRSVNEAVRTTGFFLDLLPDHVNVYPVVQRFVRRVVRQDEPSFAVSERLLSGLTFGDAECEEILSAAVSALERNDPQSMRLVCSVLNVTSPSRFARLASIVLEKHSSPTPLAIAVLQSFSTNPPNQAASLIHAWARSPEGRRASIRALLGKSRLPDDSLIKDLWAQLDPDDRLEASLVLASAIEGRKDAEEVWTKFRSVTASTEDYELLLLLRDRLQKAKPVEGRYFTMQSIRTLEQKFRSFQRRREVEKDPANDYGMPLRRTSVRLGIKVNEFGDVGASLVTDTWWRLERELISLRSYGDELAEVEGVIRDAIRVMEEQVYFDDNPNRLWYVGADAALYTNQIVDSLNADAAQATFVNAGAAARIARGWVRFNELPGLPRFFV